jgi:CO/xanthine dehydrogenase FAD-binding subunit
MKPASFEYHDPQTVDEALDLMAQFGAQARPLAGGQSLVPLMNFRLVRPAHVIDLNRIDALNFLKSDNGALRIGATTRQRQLERSMDVASRWPLLRDAAGFIGHVQIRNRGAVGGSLAHAFPSAELPVSMVTLDATMILRSKTNRRSVRAEDFFLSYMTTAMEPEELLTEIEVPELPARCGWWYQEVSRRHGDFALAGAVVDEFATAVMVMMGQKERARSKAEYFAANPSGAEALAKLFRDDRHPVSPQRTRNILRWLNDPQLVRKWQPMLVPHMQTAILEKLQQRPTTWTDSELVEKELTARR